MKWALDLNQAYSAKRREWAEDPENKLAPLPKRRTSRRRPDPGVVDEVDETEG